MHNALPVEIALFLEKALWYRPVRFVARSRKALQILGGTGPMRKEALWGLAAVGVIWLTATPALFAGGS